MKGKRSVQMAVTRSSMVLVFLIWLLIAGVLGVREYYRTVEECEVKAQNVLDGLRRNLAERIQTSSDATKWTIRVATEGLQRTMFPGGMSLDGWMQSFAWDPLFYGGGVYTSQYGTLESGNYLWFLDMESQNRVLSMDTSFSQKDCEWFLENINWTWASGDLYGTAEGWEKNGLFYPEYLTIRWKDGEEKTFTGQAEPPAGAKKVYFEWDSCSFAGGINQEQLALVRQAVERAKDCMGGMEATTDQESSLTKITWTAYLPSDPESSTPTSCAYFMTCFPLQIAWRKLWPIYLSTLLTASSLGLLVAGLLSYRLTRPIRKLWDTVKEGGEPWEFGMKSGILELDGLGEALERLSWENRDAQARLRRDLTRERDLMRAVAHELKTPAAVLRSYAEGLQEDIAPDKREAYLRVLMEEADRTGKLVEDLLELTRIDSGKTPLRMEEVDLKELLAQVFGRYERILAQKDGTLFLLLDDCTYPCDRRRMEQAADNLASNAARFCAHGGTVTVHLRREGEGAAFTVDNDGPNIPAEAMERIFEPFYRGDWARDRESGGSGLGLALVKRILALHGCCCTVQNRKNGVLFTVELPKHG